MTEPVSAFKFKPRLVSAIVNIKSGEVMDVAMPGTSHVWEIISIAEANPDKYYVIPVTITANEG